MFRRLLRTVKGENGDFVLCTHLGHAGLKCSFPIERFLDFFFERQTNTHHGHQTAKVRGSEARRTADLQDSVQSIVQKEDGWVSSSVCVVCTISQEIHNRKWKQENNWLNTTNGFFSLCDLFSQHCSCIW